MSELEQALLISQANAQPNPAAVQALGAGLGALAGGVVSTPVHMLGRAIGGMRGTNSRFRPGARMAMTIPAAIGGGIVADLIRQESAKQSPEAILLAKLKAGNFNENDRIAAQNILMRAG